MFARIAGFDANDMVLVDLEDSTLRAARSLVEVDETMVGTLVAVVQVASPPSQLLILGLLQKPKVRRRVIEAEEELVLRCGGSSLTLTANGRVALRGRQLLSRAEGQNRVQGASVLLN
jgi:hypothetical protein